MSSRVLSKPKPSDFYDQPGRHTPVLLPSTGQSDPYPAQLTALAQNVAVRKENIWLEIVPALLFLHSLFSLSFFFLPLSFFYFSFLFIYLLFLSTHTPLSCPDIRSHHYFLHWKWSLLSSRQIPRWKQPFDFLQSTKTLAPISSENLLEIMRPCYLNIIFPMGFNSLQHNNSAEGKFQIFSPGKF